MNLKKQAISGVKWTTFSSATNGILQLVQLMILARFLTTHDFGIMAILMVIIGFSQIFVDFGLSKAIIYKREISENQLSTLYWLNIIFSLFIFIFIYSISEFIVYFYEEPILKSYILIVSSVIIIQAFGLQFRALFQKELQFNILAKIDILSAIISFGLAIYLALFGYGIYALIFSVLSMAIVRTILLLYFGLKVHKPKFIFKLFEIKDFFVFGSYSTVNGIVSTIASRIDIILIGKLLGTDTLGLYSVIKELILRPAELINPIIAKVAFPTMSKVNDDLQKVKKIYLKLINYVASINFPIYVACLIFATEIIEIFLGEKWLDGVYIFQILSIWALIRSIGNPVGSLVMAVGKPQVEMYWNIFMMIFMPLIVLISSLWGIVGLSYGNLFASVLLYIPAWYFLVFKLCGATFKEYFNSSFKALYISVIVGSVVYITIQFVPNILYIKLSFGLILGAVLIFFLNKYLNRDFYEAMIGMVIK
ncbi:MOP flippase family protein [Aliarcobacter butzleri]